MKRVSLRVRSAAAAAVGVIAGGAGVAVGTAPANADVVGCATGHACIIHDTPGSPIGKTTFDEYYYSPYYNLSGEKGTVSVCNQQTGNAPIRLYSGYGASGKVLHTYYPVSGGHGNGCHRVNITPVNSIKLSPS